MEVVSRATSVTPFRLKYWQHPLVFFFNAPEFIILELRCPNAESILFTMYRRPKGLLLNNFFNVLSRFSFAYKNIIIGCNLNCKLRGSGFEATSL